jgi:hypothetical protein
MIRLKSLVHASIGILTWWFLTGCDSYYFSRPQPTDRKDLQSFPRFMQGLWYDVYDNEEGGEDVIQPDAEQTLIRVEHQRIWIYKSNEISLVDRVLTLDLMKKEEAAERMPFTSLRQERLDTSTGQIDTVDNFILRGALIYAMEDGKLRPGHPFQRRGDTILFTGRDTTCMELGYHLALRKVSEDLYALNFRGGTNHDSKDWWEVMLIRRESGGFNGYFLGDKMSKHPAHILEQSQYHYLDLDIRAGELEKMIRDSVFVQTMRYIPR